MSFVRQFGASKDSVPLFAAIRLAVTKERSGRGVQHSPIMISQPI